MTQKKIKSRPNSWGVRESILTFIPGTSVYKTMRARNARRGVLFIMQIGRAHV